MKAHRGAEGTHRRADDSSPIYREIYESQLETEALHHG